MADFKTRVFFNFESDWKRLFVFDKIDLIKPITD